MIAQYPLPVYTAVGHDQDFHVCDMVAYSYLKTPTALADELLSIYEDEDALLSSFVSRIRMAFSNRISLNENRLSLLNSRIHGAFSLRLSKMESAVEMLQTRILAADPRRILERGYALAIGPDGAVLKTASGVGAGQKVGVMFQDGLISCVVEKVEIKEDGK